jgi:hypothetical protein
VRDLWALKRHGDDGKDIDLYILEAKGKQAGGFEFYCFAGALGQVFPVSAALLSVMIGAPKNPGHGDCWRFAQKLHAVWAERGFRPMITVGLLLPEWWPDVVWTNRRSQTRPTSYFARPLADFRQFLATDAPASGPPASKRQTAFRQMLDELEAQINIRSLAQAKNGLRFRLLTTQSAPDPFFFCLSGLEERA